MSHLQNHVSQGHSVPLNGVDIWWFFWRMMGGCEKEA
jgi:hypothetical protein